MLDSYRGSWAFPIRRPKRKFTVHPTTFDRVVEALEDEFGRTNVFPHPDDNEIRICSISTNVVHSIKVERVN